MNKKLLIAAFALTLTATTFAQTAESNFTIDNNGVITKYEGWDTAVVIPETIKGIRVTGIGPNAFASNDLTSVTIPRGVVSIGNGAFQNNKLTSVTVPGNGVSIGGSAFSNNRLAAATVSGSGASISSGAFANNPITSITLGSNHVFGTGIVPGVKAVRGQLLDDVASSLFYDYVCNDRKAGTYTANRAVAVDKRVEDFSYIETQYGAYITGYTGSSGNRLEIPSRLGGLAVKVIGRLQNVSRVRIPDSVTYIGDSAFSGSQLTEITIPNSVIYIGNSAFNGNRLTSITIGKGITSISNNAFSNNQLTSVTIPDGVTSISNNAFSQNQLTSVIIPDSVTSIGNNAFSGNKLTSVIIPDSVTSIGNSAFSGNPGMSLTLGKGITSIGERQFYECGLTSVTIPDSVTSIGDQAFYQNQLTSVTIPNSVTSIGARAFYRNYLTSVTIPNSVTSIGASAFGGNRLTELTIPDSVTSIGNGAFSTNRLVSVTIGSNVTDSVSGQFDMSFSRVYESNGKAAGTYTRPSSDSYQWTKLNAPYPSGFIGTWKRDDFDNTLTITPSTIKSSSQTYTWCLIRVSGNLYTISDGGDSLPLTIQLVGGNLQISGDSGSGQDNWNGIWRKQ